MSAIDITNKAVFEQFFALKEPGAMANVTEQDISYLSQRITPISTQAGLARRFRRILNTQTYNRLMIDETKRIFQRFLKDWLQKLVAHQLQERSRPDSCTATLPALSPVKQDSAVLELELSQTLRQSREMELASKKMPFVPTKLATHPIAVSSNPETHTPKSVFKSLSGSQMAGELASYLIGLYCGIDVFHTVVPSYVWLQDGDRLKRTQGVFSRYHEDTRTAFELSCAKSEGFEALKKIPAVCVQSICLMHMLRGSEDAHMSNTLVRVIKEPVTGELCVTRIYEIDGEHIMSSSNAHSDHSSPGKQMASMRIWWLGLPQAAEPLDNSLLKLILSWSEAKLRKLHAEMNLYTEAKVSAQIWRLEKMKTMARESLFHKRPINARDLFFELIHRHPTLGLLSKASDDDIWIYNQLGNISADEIPRSVPATPDPMSPTKTSGVGTISLFSSIEESSSSFERSA